MHFQKEHPLRILLILLLIFSAPSVLAQPSRRTLIQQGEQNLEKSVETKIQNSRNIGTIVYKEFIIPLLGYSFEHPEEWDVHMGQDTESEFSRTKNAHGDYVVIEEPNLPETNVIFIYSKEFSELTSLQTVHAEWENTKRQPDHDNVYEYSNLSYIRELDNVVERETTFLGKPALELEYTFSMTSKFWKENAIMFPWGKRVFTIKYRSERDTPQTFLPVYEHVRTAFKFLGPEPFSLPQKKAVGAAFSDVPSSHPNAAAANRLKSLGIVGGYADGSFKPSATINRAEFIKIMTSEPLVPEAERSACVGSPFPDVPAEAWFAPYVCVAKARGMVGGYPDGTFRPEKTISFVEAAKIIAAFFTEEAILPGPNTWYAPYVVFLEKHHAIPTTIGALASSMTRGEMAEIVYRIFDNVQSESLGLKDLK